MQLVAAFELRTHLPAAPSWWLSMAGVLGPGCSCVMWGSLHSSSPSICPRFFTVTPHTYSSVVWIFSYPALFPSFTRVRVEWWLEDSPTSTPLLLICHRCSPSSSSSQICFLGDATNTGGVFEMCRKASQWDHTEGVLCSLWDIFCAPWKTPAQPIPKPHFALSLWGRGYSMLILKIHK